MNNGQTYELGYLALSDLSSADVEALQTTLSGIIESDGGKVVSQGDVHFIDLEYDMIKKVGSTNTRYDQAYFAWIKFTCDASEVEGIKNKTEALKEILRVLVVKTDSDDSLTDVFSPEEEGGEEEKEVSAPAPKEDPKEDAEEKKEAAASSDDLTKIEGIGPVIATTLTNGGIATFEKLAASSVDEVNEIITGVRGSHDPTTWAQQATLAHEGKWDELKTLQDELDGGKEA